MGGALKGIAANLDDLVPTTGDNDWVHDVRAESYTRHPATVLAFAPSRNIAVRTTRCDHHP